MQKALAIERSMTATVAEHERCLARCKELDESNAVLRDQLADQVHIILHCRFDEMPSIRNCYVS